jgi:hypothetical protein
MSVPKLQALKAYKDNGCKAPYVLNISIRWSFRHLEHGLRYRLDR